MHLVGFLLTLNYDARNHELKISKFSLHKILQVIYSCSCSILIQIKKKFCVKDEAPN